MTLEGIGLFAGIKGKLDYISKTQQVISENIANADTPNYQAKQVKNIDFDRVLESSLKGSKRRVPRISPEVTKAGHMTGSGRLGDPKVQDQKITYEISPSGNAVILEEQMIQANKNMMDHGLMARIMRRNVGMIQKSIGSSGR